MDIKTEFKLSEEQREAGVPKSWHDAEQWADQVNGERVKGCAEPRWSWDCNLKLDYDGSIGEVSSRFYPPAFGYGPDWDGNVTITLDGKIVRKASFKEKTLDGLKNNVEDFVNDFSNEVLEYLRSPLFSRDPNDNETAAARLRNQLTPLYSLASTIKSVDDFKLYGVDTNRLVMDIVNQAIDMKHKINATLVEIDRLESDNSEYSANYWKERCLLAEDMAEKSKLDPSMIKAIEGARSNYDAFIKLRGKL